MLTAEENEALIRVGPGTPAGELLRRYWFPIAFDQELTAAQPTRFVRLLGEDLILFKDKSGNAGLIQDHCAHRGASLLYGRVEERGIACAYHGWLYDTAGSCLECPAEPAGSMFHLTVKVQAYPIRRLAGCYWAYLGPAPAPEIPRFDVLVRRDGHRTVQWRGKVDCNYFQAMENSVDPAHLQILHLEAAGRGRAVASTTRGFTEDVESFDFYRTDYGIMKRRVYRDGRVDEHPLIFPNILRQGNGMEIRVPVDDTHTWICEIRFIPTPHGELVPEDEAPEIMPADAHKDPMELSHPFTRHRLNRVDAQDYMVWETQGPTANRPGERLATSDRGVVLLRQVMRENIARVQRGEDPLGIIRDPDHATIDTNLDESLVVELGLTPETMAHARKV
ncbi:MAG: 5,5-dehydrodivanillate O-demethylase oxygenase subunit [Chloroflexota bacterium]|nr:5,5-dehydrodivanillate O-demethylase oxygenase subunit [Chloroflexota bacterium]